MNELLQRVQGELRSMWKYRWIGAAVAWCIGVLGGLSLLFVQDRYEASAKVYVDTQTVLKPLMTGLAFQPDVDQQVKMLARTLISRPNVEQIMKSPTVGLPKPEPARYDYEVEKLKDKIKFVPSGSGNLYSISYRDVDPQRARRLVESLVNLFIASSSVAKQRDSAEASRFIEEQIKVYEGKLTEAENRVKDFKLSHFGMTGVGNQDYFARMASLSDEVAKLKLELSAAEQSRDALRQELSREDPQLPPESLPTGGVAPTKTDTEMRLEAQRRQLDDLLRRYTDAHPDVASARRTIAQLESQLKQEQDAAASSKGRGRAATNPVYQRLRVSLAEAEAQVASLRTQLGVQEGRLEQIRATATRIPQAEAELAQLNRDYDIMRKNYDQLVARREAASLGVKIDETSGLADIRLVDPPQVAPTAVVPSRRMLAALFTLLALAAGAGVAYALTQFHPVITDARALRELTRRPVLGTVGMLVDQPMRTVLRRDAGLFIGAIGLFLLMNAAWIVWLGRAARF
jgi:polysaccharide chain length determinant protein (PEP-CTERM system associated)